MLYNEFGWPGSPPGPAVTIGWMERVLRYTMSKMPRDKIMAAVSVFGFDFNLTTGRNTYVTYQSAINLAEGTTVKLFSTRKTDAHVYLQRRTGKSARSMVRRCPKPQIQNSAGLGTRIKGVALWRLGMEDPNIWPMLRMKWW